MSLGKIKVIPWYFQLIIIFYALRTSMPIVGFYTPAIVNVVVLLLLYSYLFLKRSLSIITDVAYILPIFSIYILLLLYEGSSHWPTYIYGILQILIYPLLALYLIRSGSPRFVRRIFLVIGVSYMITGITTYIGCQIFPNASRDLAAMLNSENPEQYMKYMKYNIGSFSFIYTLVLIGPLLIYMIRDKKINIILGLVSVIIIIMTVIASKYTLALLFLIVCCFLLFLPKFFGRREIKYMIIGSLVIYIFGEQFFGQFFEWLANVVNNDTVAERLSNLAVFFTEGGQYIDGDIESRMNIYSRSIDAFFKSPIVGNSYAQVGGHSYILDSLGKFGLLGGIALIIMYRRLFNVFYKPWNKQKYYGYTCFLFMIALFFAVLNPKDNLGVLTFIVPLFMASYKENYNYQNEDSLDCK
ncbi:hypothetical protein [Butyricimonas paravirosa]|uniref:hypothetical protein n=1 Tax=Butyricimonas paravirosa TaxID=1472417 RepID=UPI002A8168D3|nr:hypothetical protein [Butyricimonas paravirosa]